MKRSALRLPVLSNPVACHRIADPDHVDQVRRIDCRSYDRCLDVATENEWRGFHCNECRGYEARTPDERRKDMLAALRLLAETQLMLQLSQPALAFEDETGEDDEDDEDGQADDDGDGSNDGQAGHEDESADDGNNDGQAGHEDESADDGDDDGDEPGVLDRARVRGTDPCN
jgi:hypothetical protein